jgi:predicted ATPase/transcriptional regulator with XRE-family HTH domain
MTASDPGDFAELLRQRRRAAGLTQAELATRAGLAVRTVRDAERGRTNRLHRTTAALLANALGLVGAERAEFVAATRRERPAPSNLGGAAMTGRGNPLPPPVPLIGRDAEVAELAKLVADQPNASDPITLTGLAGVGKSALALAVAHRVADRFPGGVAGVTIDEAGEVSETLASVCFVFGVASAEELADLTTRAPSMLVLDAVERAPQKVQEVLRLLPSRLRILVAGQAPLGTPGEQVWLVTPLESPPANVDAELAEIRSYPAAALFLERLARVRTEPLAPDEVPALAGLVRRLGGLPLALELAAAHGRLLRIPEILERYGDRVLDLGAGAELTLRESVASSYRLLSTATQRALRRLSVFRHRWSVELAEAILGDAGDPVPTLDRLVRLGLVAVSGAREHRFRLLDVVRDFATEQAEQHGELALTRRAHARVIAQLAERSAPELAGPGLRTAVARLDDLAADVWAALSHAANDDPHTALRLACQLPRWWRLRGRDLPGRRWLRRLLNDPRTADAEPALRAWAQVGLAQLANEHGEGEAERGAIESALVEFRRLGDLSGELAACNVLSALCLAAGDHDGARRHTEAALATATRAGRLRDATVAQTNLTWHDIRIGDLAAARRRLAIVDRLAAEVGEERLRVLAAANLAEVARLQGRFIEAVATGRRVLVRLSDVGDPGHRRRVLGTVGQSLAALGRIDEATRVLASLRADAGGSPHPGGQIGAEAICAAIEGRIAVARGDHVAAAEWFAAAASAFRRGQDRRDVVEALVLLAACTPAGSRRDRVLAELTEVADEGGFTLVAAERQLLDQAPDHP